MIKGYESEFSFCLFFFPNFFVYNWYQGGIGLIKWDDCVLSFSRRDCIASRSFLL